MPYQDFRQFLDVLRRHGELIDVNRPVALNDVGKAMKQSYVRQGPALMFKEGGIASCCFAPNICDRNWLGNHLKSVYDPAYNWRLRAISTAVLTAFSRSSV